MVPMDSDRGHIDASGGRPHEKPSAGSSSDRRAEQGPPADALASTFGFEDDERWLRLAKAASVVRSRDPEMLGPYRVLLRAGAGGQGTVYKVLQPITGRPVAMKRLNLGAFASTRDRVRFQRELSATATLQHPGIVTLLGHDEVEGQPVILMEWVEGQPIDLWSSGSSVADILAVFAKLCDAVAHAHRRGVLHRDLKPSNVLVVPPPDSPEVASASAGTHAAPDVKVLDFGLSRLVATTPGDAPNTLTEGFMGTPAYASPEQAAARWHEVDTRSDVYAIGVMLYEALTGVRPFCADNLPELLTEISHKAPPRPSLVARDTSTFPGNAKRRSQAARTPERKLDGELDAIVLKALAKAPSARYQSADAFAADLRRKLTGHGVLAHPPKLLYQSRAFARQHRVAVVVCAVALVALAGLATVSTVLASRLATRSSQVALALQSQEAATSKALVSSALAQSAAMSLLESLAEVVKQSSEAGVVAPRELTDNVQARLRAGSFAGLPEVEVSLWSTLATLACSGRDVALAESFVSEAAKSLDRVSPTAPAYGHYRNVQGLLHENAGRTPDAIWHYDQALCILEPALGKHHPQTMRVLANLAGVHSTQGNTTLAVQLARDLLERRLLTSGPDAIETASAWAILAAVLRRDRQHESSRAALNHAIGIVYWTTQAKRAEAQRVAREVARRARDDGDLPTREWALRIHVQAEVLPKGLGTKMQGTARADLAEFLHAQARTSEALPFARAAHAENHITFAQGHHERARSAVILSECLVALAQQDQSLVASAARAVEQAVSECQALPRPNERLLRRARAALSRIESVQALAPASMPSPASPNP
jgi:serine/threonine protein kinase